MIKRIVILFICILVTRTRITVSFQLPSVASCPSNTVFLQANYTRQFIESPNFPSSYPRPSSCDWKITAVQGDIIVFRFFAFDLEPSVFCYRDYFSIIDGHTSFHNEIINMCGSYSSDVKYTTIEKTALVEFLSIATGQRRTGFRVGFWTEDTINEPVIKSHYTYANYVLMGISGVIGVAVSVGFIVIIKSSIDRRKMEEES